jgi:hypothetical protein
LALRRLTALPAIPLFQAREAALAALAALPQPGDTVVAQDCRLLLLEGMKQQVSWG